MESSDSADCNMYAFHVAFQFHHISLKRMGCKRIRDQLFFVEKRARNGLTNKFSSNGRSS